jgi:hypothetical protein
VGVVENFEINSRLGLTAASRRKYNYNRFAMNATAMAFPASWLSIRGWGRLSVQGAGKRVKSSISDFFPRGDFLCGNGAPFLVSWVRYFGASVLALFAPNGLQQAL